MKPAFLVPLALACALAACGAQAGSAAPTTPSAAPAVVTAESAPAGAPTGAGTVHLLRETYGGGAAYALYNAAALGYPGYSVLTRTDYKTLTETPLCSAPGCDHRTPACPAWRFDALGSGTLLVEDDTCYEFYLRPQTDLDWGTEALDARQAEALAAEGDEPRILVSDGAGSRRLLAKLPAEMAAGPGFWGSVTVSTDHVAADDRNFYLLWTVTGEDQNPTAVQLVAVGKADGAVTPLHTWTRGEVDGGLDTLSLCGAQGRTLFLGYARIVDDPDAELNGTVPGGGTLCYDLDSGALRDGAAWQNGWTGADGTPNRAATSVVSVPAGQPTGYLQADLPTGTLTALDFATGAPRTVCTGLPTSDGWEETSCELTECGDWYLARVLRWNRSDPDGGDEERLFLIPHDGGAPAEITLQYYESAHGTRPITVLDVWADSFFCLYGYRESSIQDINKDGSLFAGTAFEELEGLLPLDDLRAGNPAYRPVQRWQPAG